MTTTNASLQRHIIKALKPKLTFEEKLKEIRSHQEPEKKRSIDGKMWQYCIYDEPLKSLVSFGTCIIMNISYDRNLDYNTYTIQDIDSNKVLVADDFHIRLWND